MSGGWTVVIRSGWYLPHLVNMLREYNGNTEQNECRDEVIAQIEAQMIGTSPTAMTTRPMVVIDPEDRDQLERLHDLYWKTRKQDATRVDALQAAFRELADPAPEVYSHLVVDKEDALKESICGKVWRPEAEVNVVGKCPDCLAIVNDEEWTA